MMTEWLYCTAHCMQEEPHQSDWTFAAVWRLSELCHRGNTWNCFIYLEQTFSHQQS